MPLEKIISSVHGLFLAAALAGGCSTIPRIPDTLLHKPKNQQTISQLVETLPQELPLLTSESNLSTGLASFRRLRDEEIKPYQKLYFDLPDGTHQRGLYIEGKKDTIEGKNEHLERKKNNVEGKPNTPLLIATFGFLSDIQAHAVYNFFNILQNSPLGEYNVLIMDHPSSAPFYCANGEVSWGGSEEGAFIVDVAQQMKKRYGYQSVHVLGVSMGGTGAIHAASRGKGIIDSVLAISPVTDYTDVPGAAFRSLNDHSKFGKSFWSLAGKISNYGFKELIAGFNEVVEKDPLCRGKKIRRNFTGKQLENLFLGTRRYNHLAGSLEEYLVMTDANQVARAIEVPLYLLHANDDAVVGNHHFYRFMLAARGNKNVTGQIVPDGGHWGFSAAYGDQWIGCLIKTYVDYWTPGKKFSIEEQCR